MYQDFYEYVPDECTQCAEYESRLHEASKWLLEIIRDPFDMQAIEEINHQLGTAKEDELMMKWIVENNRYLKNLGNERVG